MERWGDLKIFLAAYRAGSCAGAGAQLGLNQSTVSRRLAALEKDLGVRLFDRVPEGLTATAAAEEILPQAELFEATAAEVMAAVEGLDTGPGGVVRVALPEMLASELVASALPAFLSAHPGLRLELISGDTLKDLSRREADLALRFVRPSGGDLVFRRVANLEFGVFGSRAYLESKGALPKGRRGLEGLDWLDWDTNQSHLPDAQWLRAILPEVTPILRTTSLTVRLRATLEGLGVSILARALALRSGDLVEVPVDPPPPTIPVWLVGHRALRNLPRIKAVWRFLEERSEELQPSARPSP